uniref:RGS domain-containing protein n=2 Tax=Meloidogyne enterolobii TaxID=390850 RepID=A0A6V7X1S9_MELEN|nr:unnamed protein product [Meloidogyne enterolobii]
MDQRRFKWASSLEEVLSDFDALQLFQSWMGVDDDSSEHPLRLHYAIIAYRAMLSRNDPRVMQLAREIYNKFLRPKSGLCAFIDPIIRERVGQCLRQSTICPPNLFDECLPSIDTFLRRQHAIFVSSHEFLDKFNSSLCLDDQAPSCSSNTTHKSSSTNRSSRKGQHEHVVPTLTADMLKRSQRDREAMVPAGTTSQRLFRPVSKLPYIGGQAQPSKNGSAASSAFSSESTGRTVGSGETSNSMKLLREDQRRMNHSVMKGADDISRNRKIVKPISSNHPRHDTAEERRNFAELLQRKLQALELRYRQEESIKEQIERINSARQKGVKTSTRELIGSTLGCNDSLLLLEAEAVDADEELENYYRLKLADFNSSVNNSGQLSPHLASQSLRT